jgi:hypothetical protein
MSELTVHPVAALFPMLADDELDELAADDGNRIVLTGASLGTGVATATHEAAALVLESPYLSALDVASAR